MKHKKAGIKLIIQLIVLACVTAVAELLLLNVGNWKLLTDSDLVKNRTYALADCEKVNWVETSGLQSQRDPMLIIPNLDCYVDSLLIQAQLIPEIPYIDLFYTNETYLQYGDIVLREEKPSERTVFSIGDTVSSLRIDLGDDPGTELRQFAIVVNPVKLQFSVPVVVAVLLIYLSARFLFSLQETPDYGLEVGGRKVKDGEDDPS